MNLQPISPPMSSGQRVYCSECSIACGTRANGDLQAWADLDAQAGMFYCDNCAFVAMNSEVKFIRACGYRVFMRSPSDKYCHFTDGKRIAYAQWSDYRTSVTSVHVPTRENGSGFGIAESITAETLSSALNCFIPHWASGAVTKYKDWDAFHNASEWNRQLKEVFLMNTELRVTFDTGNAAFDNGNGPEEAARALRIIAGKVSSGQDSGSVFDSNGNRIGEWEVEYPEESDDDN